MTLIFFSVIISLSVTSSLLKLVPLFILVHVHEVVGGGGVLLRLVGHHLGAVLQLVQPLASLNHGHLRFGNLALRIDTFGLNRNCIKLFFSFVIDAAEN